MHTKPQLSRVCTAAAPQDAPSPSTGRSSFQHSPSTKSHCFRRESTFQQGRKATTATEPTDFTYQPTAVWELNLPRCSESATVSPVKDMASPHMSQIQHKPGHSWPYFKQAFTSGTSRSRGPKTFWHQQDEQNQPKHPSAAQGTSAAGSRCKVSSPLVSSSVSQASHHLL